MLGKGASVNSLALTFEHHAVRVVMVDGEPWWVLADLCGVLEIANPQNVAARLDDDEKKTIQIMDGNRGNPNMTVVSEPGVYAVLRSSHKPQAKRFDRWLRHDVLPEIRRTGGYRGSLPTLDAIGNLFDRKLEPVHRGMAEMRIEIAEVRGNVTFLTKRVDDMAPRHDFTPNTRRIWVCVVWKFYPNGICPCCRRVKIISDRIEIKGTAHADHFNGRERNKPQDGWLVCVGCNYKLEHDAQFKERAKPHFTVFQDNLLQLFGTATKQSSRKRNHSRTISSKQQPDLFG